MNDGCLWEDPELSDPYRDDTQEYVRICLGLATDSDRSKPCPTNATISAFEAVGIAIRNAYNYGEIRY